MRDRKRRRSRRGVYDAVDERRPLRLASRSSAVLKRSATALLDQAVNGARAAECSPADLDRRIDDRLARVLAAARATSHYSASIPRVVGDPRAVLAQLPLLSRDDLRARPSTFMTSSPGSCFVRTTTGSSGQHGYIVKPRSSLTERAAIERRWFDSLALPVFFDLTMVTAWQGLRPFCVRFNDWRIRYRAMSADQAQAALTRGKRIGDLVVTTPRIAAALPAYDAGRGHRYASSFEFSRPARALFLSQTPGEPECAGESYVAGELGAPIAFRFPGCPALHVNADAILVEIADVVTGSPLDDGVAGRIVVTDLLNTAMPVLRYELGDFAVVTGRGRCACGRITPRLQLLARELSRRDEGDDWMARATDSSAPARLLVKVGPADYVVFAADSFARPPLPAPGGAATLRVTTDIPTLVAPLLRCPTPLSVAERVLPS